MSYLGKYIDHLDHEYFYYQYTHNGSWVTVRAKNPHEARTKARKIIGMRENDH